MGHTVRRCVVLGLFAVVGLALSSPAFAGSGGLTSSATFDFAGGPENNDVTLAATGGLLTLTDTAAVPTLTSTAALDGCRVSGDTISCPAAGVSEVTIEGGAGNDRLTIDPTVGTSSSVSFIELQGNAGNDVLTNDSSVSATVDYSAAAAGVVVDLGSGVVSQDGDGGQDTLANIENVNGSALGDSITGDGNDNVINGGSGDDRLIGGGGNDLISGGNGDDFLAGNGGNDLLDGGSGVDMVDYSAAAAGVVVDLGSGVVSQDGDGGQDTLANIENVNGSALGDSITGDGNDNVINGGSGDDTLIGGGGNDLISGGNGDDFLAGNGGNDLLDGGSGVDMVDYSAAAAGVVVDLGSGVVSQDGDGGQDTLANIENVNGSALGDSITGDGNDNVINGGSGDDRLIGGGGNDLISGGNGDDFLAGNGGNDLLDGGSGVDMVDYSAAAAGVVVDLGSGVVSQDGDGGQDTLANIENVNGTAQGDFIAARDGLPEGITCGGGEDSVIADAIDVVAADCEQVALPTPPTITAAIVGTAGLAGWYTSDVTVSWTVTATGSTVSSSTGCDPVTITADTSPAGITLTCTATSDGGTTTKSVTVKRDATPPTVLYAGNQGSYGILQTVAITCTATDPSPGSGIASSSCANIQGPAYGFGAGAHTFSAVAADAAGNQGQATTSFSVTPTAADLCTLTKQFAESSAKFQALGPKQQAAVDAIVTGACNAIAKIVVNLGPKQKAVLVALYKAGVASLAQAGWLTSAQAGTLDQFAGAL